MYTYGIDLGTTYSCIARADADRNIEIIKNIEGKTITPSVVEFISPTEIIVGETAKGDAILAPDNVVLYIKRSIGKKNENRNYHGQTYTPEQISAFILKKLIADAERTTGEKVRDAVITVPAYFGFDERQATESAGKMAGLNVLGIVNEPTAAAIAYGAQQKAKADKVVLVYDLGGGTFDVAVAEVVGDHVNVVSTEGNQALGGKDWDAELLSYFVAQFCEQTDATANELYENADVLNELILKSEAAKQELTSKNTASFILSMGRGKRAKLEITVDKFDEITRHHLVSTIELTKIALQQAASKMSSKGTPCDRIDEIIFVGGSTRMRQVKAAMQKEFGIEPQVFEPDEAVARGAALLAYFLSKEKFRTGGSEESKSAVAERFSEVSSKSYGIEAQIENAMILSHVIFKNDAIPCSNTKTYGTIYPDQRRVDIIVYESNATDDQAALSFGKRIAEGRLELPDGLPVGSPIDVTFSLDRNGMLNIVAVERYNGSECKIAVKTAGLSEVELFTLQAQTSAMKLQDGA